MTVLQLTKNDFTERFKQLEFPVQNNSVEQPFRKTWSDSVSMLCKVIEASAYIVDITMNI